MNWKSIAILSFAIFAMAQAVGFASGMSFGADWTMYGASLEEAAANAILVRRVVVAITAFSMYLVFFHGVTTKRPVSFVAVFIGTGFFNLMFEALMRSPFPQAVLWSFSPILFGAGTLALATSMLLFRSNKTMQPT